MTKDTLLYQLNEKRLSKEEIIALVQQLLQFPQLTLPLLEEVFRQDQQAESFNASWVFDHLMRKDLTLLLPYTEKYVEGLPNLKTESCMRPMAHVMELLTIALFVNKQASFLKAIDSTQQEQMVTVAFDWLIGNYKVATKVFAMTSLFHLGTNFSWVRLELRSIIEQQMINGTAGLVNRGSKILEALKKLGY